MIQCVFAESAHLTLSFIMPTLNKLNFANPVFIAFIVFDLILGTVVDIKH